MCSAYSSVRFAFVREIAALDILNVTANGIVDDGAQVGIAAQEAGREALGHAQHVGNDQHLLIVYADYKIIFFIIVMFNQKIIKCFYIISKT